MIRKIIHVSDIHVRTFKRLDEYNQQLNKFVEKCKEIAKDFTMDEIRIVICGDTFHTKLQISNEQITLVSNFLRKLENICKVIIISGNHDLVVENESRMDTVTALMKTANFNDVVFLDGVLGYESGIIVDDNVTWALYSIFDNFRRPDIESAKEQYPDNKVIGLYHGRIVGASLNNGTSIDSGLSGNEFNGCDVAMLGDIHKRQEIKKGDTILVYSGSLIQQTMGETVTQHGFALWDVDTLTYEFVDIENEYSQYQISIKSIEDIDDDKEKILNF